MHVVLVYISSDFGTRKSRN